MKISTNFLLFLGVTFLCLSGGFFYISLNETNTTILIDKKVDMDNVQALQVTEAPVVLGAADSSNCETVETYRKKVNKFRPNFVVYAGTEMKELPTEEILACASIVKVPDNGFVCPSIEIKFDYKCFEKLIAEKLVFDFPSEQIGGIYKISAEVRIADEIPDYKLLTELMKDMFYASTKYKDIVSANATIRNIVIQAPMNGDLPNTDGKFARKYIEVDGSRQLLFYWNNGKYDSYKISGAFWEYNPVGVHKILNKSTNAWSSTASKWMPYWMAFAYDPKQKTMLGFHALVYWYEGFEKTGSRKIWEDESHIGTPRSTGCLRLSQSEAKKLYYWANVGDLVVVHN